jgi:hypothetical protein
LLVQQAGHTVSQQLIQHSGVLAAKVGQGVIIEADAAGQPLVSQMFLAEPIQFAGTADITHSTNTATEFH